MPHIHTAPGQHDLVVSAFIIRLDQGEPKVLLHMHRKHHVLMQIGGHMELDETPWQAIAHELREECGYKLEDLQVLQPDAEPVEIDNVVTHPTPVLACTYKMPDEHFHSDLSWAFVTDRDPAENIGAGESSDIRWLSLAELREQASKGLAAKDVAEIYGLIVSRYLRTWHRIPASKYLTTKPLAMSM